MEQDQKESSKEWGAYMRSPYKAFPRRSVLGRIQEEGPGASARGIPDFVPVDEFCPEGLAFIHRAWANDMDDQESNVFFLQFVAKGAPARKAEVAGVSRKTYYRILERAMNKIPWE